MKIDIDLDALDDVSRAAKQIGDDVADVAKAIHNTAGNVQTAWRSRTSSICVEEIDTVAKNLEGINTELDQLSVAVGKYSTAMRQLEKANSALFGRKS